MLLFHPFLDPTYHFPPFQFSFVAYLIKWWSYFLRFVDDGDFSKFGEDFGNEDDSDLEEGESEEDEDNDEDSDQVSEDMDNTEDERGVQAIKRFHREDQSEELKKGQAVKNQLGKSVNMTICYGKFLVCMCVRNVMLYGSAT